MHSICSHLSFNFSNGFAFRHSDLDISLTFRDIPTRCNFHHQTPSSTDLYVFETFQWKALLITKACIQHSLTFFCSRSEGLDCIKIIEELSERVKRMAGMRNVVAITSAKVFCTPYFGYFASSSSHFPPQNVYHFSGSDCEADPPAMPDWGRPLPL